MESLEIVQMKNKFAQLKQKPGISIGEFKKEFDVLYEALLGAGVPVTAAPELAMLFTNSIRIDMLQCSLSLRMMLPSAEHFLRRCKLLGPSHQDGRQPVPRLLVPVICNQSSFLQMKSVGPSPSLPGAFNRGTRSLYLRAIFCQAHRSHQQVP